MRAVGYVRLSKDTEETTSPARQRGKIKALCKERGWDLVETFEDIDQSAFNGHVRPAYDEMVTRLDDTDAIVFWRPDRLSRSVSDFSKLLDTCQKKKVALVSTDYPIDTSSAMGRAFVQITSVFAELEAGTTSERSRQMMAYKREHGEWVGRVPFGWRLVGKHLERDEDEQRQLQDAARRYVAGDSFNRIAADLGMRTAVLSRILHSERVHEALPEDLSGPLADAILARKYQRIPTSTQSLLGGIARCGVCNATMRTSSTRAGRRGRWGSYRCDAPGHAGIARPWLDERVTEQVLDYIDVDKLLASRKAKPKRTRKVSAIEARLEHLDTQYVEGKLPKGRFDRMNGALLAQLNEAQQGERDNGIDLPAELARNLAQWWPTFAIETQRRIIKAVVETITVAKASGHGPIEPERVQITWRA